MSNSLYDLYLLHFSDKGQLFGWGNSEYNQLAMVTNENQINIPRHLPVNGCGHIIKAVAGGSICAVLNGMFLYYIM